MKKEMVRESANPLYKQLISRIRADIDNGVYPVDSRIPSEQELCEKYDVSRITVRKALEELSDIGLLVRRQGKGTFVSVPSIEMEIKQINSFHDACKSAGRIASTRVLGAREVAASDEDIKALRLNQGSRVIEVDRIRMADDVPVILERNHFSMGYSYLLESDLSGSLYSLLRAYGVEPTQAVHEISLVLADENKAKLLGLDVGSPLLFLHEIIYDQKGRPLHVSHQYIRGDKFTLKL